MTLLKPSADRRAAAPIVSIVCHAAAFLLLFGLATRGTLMKPIPSSLCCYAALQIAGGSQAMQSPLPPAPFTSHPLVHRRTSEPVTQPVKPSRDRHPAKASGTNAEVARPSDVGTNSVAGNGSDAQNTTPAFPIFSPHPALHDRSLLPANERQVIVDVKLNAEGEVIGETFVRGLGNALDRMSLET